MKEAKTRTKPEKRDGAPGELRVVAINCNPAPDAEDRLRRLFTLLLEHVAGERRTAPEDETSADAPYAGEDA